MRCIFCSAERPPSLEHIFSLAIGGTITTDRVCAGCNSILGSRVDSALNNFLPVRTRRAELGLAGNSGELPSIFEMLLGDQKLIGPEANRIRTSLNKATGKLDHRQLYHATDVVTPDGKKARQITLDERDKNQIPKVIQRERKRHGLPPLSPEELAIEASKFTVKTVEPLLVQVNIDVSFAFLRQAMMKIAYELAFLWLGESYLDGPLAVELRDAILKDDIASTNSLAGYVGWAESCSAFNFFRVRDAGQVQVIGWLVEQQDVGRRSQSAGQRRAACLTTGQRHRIFVAGKAEFLEQIQRAVPTIRRRAVKPCLDICQGCPKPARSGS